MFNQICLGLLVILSAANLALRAADTASTALLNQVGAETGTYHPSCACGIGGLPPVHALIGPASQDPMTTWSR